MNPEKIIEDLKAAVASGVVWNADLELWKGVLGNRVWRDTQEMIWPAMRDGVDKKFGYPTSPGNLHDVKSFSKKIEAGRAKGVPVPESVDVFLKKWVPVKDLVEAAKPLVRKGRKPSENVNPEDRRTLENTGTCPVCHRNHKLNVNGGMVQHGYEVRWHEHQGGCFGVARYPWEVSPDGKIAFQTAVRAQLQTAEKVLENLKVPGVQVWSERTKSFLNPGEAHYEEALRNRTREKDREVRELTSLLERLAEQIESWAADTLPGVKAGFAR